MAKQQTTKQELGDVNRDSQYLSFRVGAEEYGIPIKQVIEILSMMEITNIPHTPNYVKGIINLRGKIIPVIDLRLKFGLDEKEYNERTCIIVVDVTTPKGRAEMSVAVDFVSEVINVLPADISDPPDFGSTVSTDYIMGIARVQDKVKILLNIEKVLNDENIVNIMDNVHKMKEVNA